jgi:hypothetical protein
MSLGSYSDEDLSVRRNRALHGEFQVVHEPTISGAAILVMSLTVFSWLTGLGIRWKDQDPYSRLQEVSSGP